MSSRYKEEEEEEASTCVLIIDHLEKTQVNADISMNDGKLCHIRLQVAFHLTSSWDSELVRAGGATKPMLSPSTVMRHQS